MDLNSSEDEEELPARVRAADITAAAGACAGVAAEPVLRVVKLRVLDRHSGLPEGWAVSKHWATNKPQYKQYTGPNGEVLTDQSLRQAMRSEPDAASNPFATPSFATKSFAAATSAASSTPAAASEVINNNCWAEIEVVADDLIENHPPPSELVGSDVCVMAAAYPSHALSSSGVVGWRGLVTHSRGGAVRVFGSWFRLADEAFIKPIKEAVEEPSLQEPEQVPSPQPSVPALKVGQSVDARFGQKRGWFPGVIRHINDDDTLAIDYNDGDQEEKVLRKHARRRDEPARPRPPLPPTLSGRLRTAPQRLDASVLAAPQYAGKQASAHEASRREDPALGEEEEEEEEEEAFTSPWPSSSARAVAAAVIDELQLPASASTSGGVRTSTNHGRFRGRVTVLGSNGGLRHEGSAAGSVVDEVEGLQLHLSASSSGYKGVFSIRSGRFQAKFCSNGRHVFLGTFDTAVEAAVAYSHAASEESASKLKHATLTTAAAGSVLLSFATSPKRADQEQATNADPPAKRQRTSRSPPAPPAPLLAADQVRKLMEAKELKDQELIDEDEYKQMKAAIIGTVFGS